MAQKSSAWAAETPSISATAAVVFAERVQAAFSSAAAAPAVLQRGLPGGGAEVVAVESPATVPRNGGGPSATQRSKPALPGARQEPETSTARDS